MKTHPNFYENLKEANMRLKNTVVMYEDEPWYIWAITDHKGDGVFRVYMQPLGTHLNSATGTPGHVSHNMPPEHPQMGPMLDEWMKDAANKDKGLVRKKMNSPHFNRFRPFPLGMCNAGVNCFYVERVPNRKTEQGLIRSMLHENLVTCGDSQKRGLTLDLFSDSFKACILGDYPSAHEVLTNLNDPKIDNNAVAFNRNFALVRGPLDMLFLAYKDNIVGVMPRNDFSEVRLGRKFKHCREVTQELNLFNSVI